MVIIRRDESEDGGRERLERREGSCNDTAALRRGQTAPLNYRLMKTLREMKSLSDGARSPVNEAMGRRVPRAFSNLYGQPDWELSLAGAFSKLLPPGFQVFSRDSPRRI